MGEEADAMNDWEMSAEGAERFRLRSEQQKKPKRTQQRSTELSSAGISASRPKPPDTPNRRQTMYWLSFCDGDLPKGSQFLGVVIAPGNNIEEAARWCWDHNINPGSEVGCVKIPDDAPVPPEFRGVLLQKDKIAELEAIMAKTARSPKEGLTDAHRNTRILRRNNHGP